ncbi:DUF6332 family protein [Streptomyces silvensis]|uniref:DUF6332 family protein n=1 Tax=Streptomyces silvensis TaxID=1765722 RepID=UPI0007C6B482|nr:DUF6332 family protein [Streptomyces silvensis]
MERDTGRRRRSQAERDAVTIEIGYALVSATALALAVIGVVVAGPALAFDLPKAARGTLFGAGVSLAVTAFVVRLVTVLWRFTARERERRAALDGGAPYGGMDITTYLENRDGGGQDQPSQPGRTRPDS